MKRTVNMRWAPAFLFILGTIFVVIRPVRAAGPITVTTTADAIANDGLCSLREAIIAANTDSAFGSCPAGSGADTIVFSPSLSLPATFVLTRTGANENNANTGDLDLAGTLLISGTATDSIIIDGNSSDRVFEILAGARITISDVTVRNGTAGADIGGGLKVLGSLTMSNSSIEANQGGGIGNDGGLITLSNTQVISNSGGYGIRNQNLAWLTFNGGLVEANQGGGIYNVTSTATLSGLSIVNNTGGGGVYNSGFGLTRLRLNHSLVSTNTATSGAGIFNEGIGARVNVYDSRIGGNTATISGGGIFNNGTMTIDGSTIDHNQARSGGGIEHFGGSLHLTNDTLSSNVASDNGGGLYNEGDAIVTNVTYSNNTSSGPDTGANIFNDNAQLSIENTIVANPGAGGNCFNSGGFLNSLGHNLDSGNTCGFSAAGDISNADPLLGPLQDNGGTTFTHALLPGSPAIDKGDDASCLATDQRGVVRPQGTACDIGAYEFEGTTADLSLAAAISPSPVGPGEQLTYTFVISNLGPNAATAVTLEDTLSTGVTFSTATIDGGEACAYDAGTVTCSLASLAAGAGVTATLVVTTPMCSGLITNTASISAATPDPSPDNSEVVIVTAVGETPGGQAGPVYLPLILHHSGIIVLSLAGRERRRLAKGQRGLASAFQSGAVHDRTIWPHYPKE